MQQARSSAHFFRRLTHRFQSFRKPLKTSGLRLALTLVIITFFVATFIWHAGYIDNIDTTNASHTITELSHSIANHIPSQLTLLSAPHTATRNHGILLAESRKELSADVPRRDAIRDAMSGAWGAYVKDAWGYDEWRWNKLTRKGEGVKNELFGNGCLSLTIIDAADTLWIMGLKKEYEMARDFLVGDENRWNWEECGTLRLSTFEVVIRILGGLISLFELTEDERYLIKAEDLGRRLGKEIMIEGEGLPRRGFTMNEKFGENELRELDNTVLAEAGTIQMEFRHLAVLSKKKEFQRLRQFAEDVVLKIIPAALKKHHGTSSVLPFDSLMWDPNNKEATWTSDRVSINGGADSYYEYLIKAHLQGGAGTGSRESGFRKLFDNTMNEAFGKVIVPLDQGKIIMAGVYEPATQRRRLHMEHLACFIGGALALGANTIGSNISFAQRTKYMAAAAGITETCYKMYRESATGLSPEAVSFRLDMIPGKKLEHEMSPGSGANRFDLRPEAVESMFYMYRFTGDNKYREWGWEIFQSIEKYCKTKSKGYSGAQQVWKKAAAYVAVKDGTMHSWFLAETLKYLYLLFADSSVLSLDEWVFNTEAHPFRVRPELSFVNGTIEREHEGLSR